MEPVIPTLAVWALVACSKSDVCDTWMRILEPFKPDCFLISEDYAVWGEFWHLGLCVLKDPTPLNKTGKFDLEVFEEPEVFEDLYVEAPEDMFEYMISTFYPNTASYSNFDYSTGGGDNFYTQFTEVKYVSIFEEKHCPTCCDDHYHPPVNPPVDPEDPMNPSPVPLPGGFWLTLTAIGAIVTRKVTAKKAS